MLKNISLYLEPFKYLFIKIKWMLYKKTRKKDEFKRKKSF